MTIGKGLPAAAMACVAGLGMQAAGLAQPETAGVEAKASEKKAAENRAILDALLKRRALVAQLPGGVEDKRYALDFLDGEIAKVRSAIAVADERSRLDK